MDYQLWPFSKIKTLSGFPVGANRNPKWLFLCYECCCVKTLGNWCGFQICEGLEVGILGAFFLFSTLA